MYGGQYKLEKTMTLTMRNNKVLYQICSHPSKKKCFSCMTKVYKPGYISGRSNVFHMMKI